MQQGLPSSRLLVTGARVYTACPDSPWAEAVVAEGDRLCYVGTEQAARDRAGAGAEHVHVPGGLVVPGLNDSHIHLSYAAQTLRQLDLGGVDSLPELGSRLRAFADAHPEGGWIDGYGLTYEVFLGLPETEREAIDAALSDRPVYLRAFDFHTSWCNTEALRRAGIERGAAVSSGGEVVIDPHSGLATGMLKERSAYSLVESLIPEPSSAEMDDLLAEAIRLLNGLGITSIQNMNADPSKPGQYERLHARGDLTVRAGHYAGVWDETALDYVDEVAALKEGHDDAYNHVIGIKVYLDGVVESETALMLQPYHGSSNLGTPAISPEHYRAAVRRAHSLHLGVATHAIGDGAVRLALDTYEAAGQNGRQRIEHIEVIDPADVPRFRRQAVTASMQPLHMAPFGDPREGRWLALAGPQREPYAFAWQSLLHAGAYLAFGSDWPIVSPDPRLGLRAALARTGRDGEPPGGWQPQQSTTLAQALDAYTREAARAEGREGEKGMLQPGMLADITAFSRDLFKLQPKEIPDVEIALTVVGGRAVHRTT